jgi:BASS family bile acid:Na+ symporter
MFGMGMSLVVDDFKRVVLFPKAVILGLVGQILLLPLIAFVLIKGLAVEPMIAIGVMLIAACPGGSSSNLISHLAKGDTALSISITAISSLITVITIPLIVGLSMEYFLVADQSIHLPVIKTITTLIAITLLPVSLGMFVRYKFTQFAIKQESKINVFSGLFLAFLVIAILVQQIENVKAGIVSTGLVVVSLNISSMIIGFVIAKFFKLNSSQSTTIGIEVGIQNGTLAILIATTILHQSELAIPAAIYSLTMFISGGFVILLRR